MPNISFRLYILYQPTVSAFTLYSKSIYLLDGSDANNLDNAYPFQSGKIGEVGGRAESAVFVDLNGYAWVFGGRGSDNVHFNDLWKFSGGMWYWMGGSSGDNDPGMYNHTGSTGIPASRVAPASWVDAVGDFWIFGGSSSTQVQLNDLWRYNIATNTWTWIYGDKANDTLITRTDGPTRRSKSACWARGTKLLLFGGLQADLNATNDIWEFDTQSLNWTLIQANQPESYVTNGGYPSARSGAAVAVDANGIWIFGGRTTDNRYLSDVWRYTTTWRWAGGPSIPDTAGSYPSSLGHTGGYPPPREGACSWFDAEGYLWIYGGHRADVNSTYYLGDFWKAIPGQTVDFLWAGTSTILEFPLTVNSTGGPGPRAFAVCWQDLGGDLFFFSGVASAGFRNDVWVLDMDDCINNGGCYTNCTNLIAQPYECTPCPSGKQGDGRTNCTDIDQCAVRNGGCDLLTNCTNNFNAPPNCSACPLGYNGTGYTGCIIFDWCTLPVGSGGCDSLVTCNFTRPNTPPICGPCPTGYNGTGSTGCTDYNECLISNGGCDPLSNCTNNLGGATPTCSDCPRPFYSGNGATGCRDVDECAINKGGCDPLTSCTNNIGARPTCGSCPPFFIGTGEFGCVDFNECSVNNGGCTPEAVCTNNIGGPPTCGPCVNGFIGNNFCSSASHSSKNAGLIAGVTIGGFIFLLIMIGLIFHFTKGKSSKSPSSMRLSQSSESAQRFELKALSQA